MRGVIEWLNEGKQIFRINTCDDSIPGRKCFGSTWELDITESNGHCKCIYRRGTPVVFDLNNNREAVNVFQAFPDEPVENYREDSVVVAQHPTISDLFFAVRSCNACQITIHRKAVVSYGDLTIGTKINHAVRLTEARCNRAGRMVLRATAEDVAIYQEN